jgi:ABC-2 type transport system ATP-binding protein
LTVRTRTSLVDPAAVFGSAPGVTGWRADAPASYVLNVSDTTVAAPAVARGLVAAGADVLSLAESHHSLEDVYLQFVEGHDEEDVT